MLKTQEHTDLMAMFEREYGNRPPTREAKEEWPKGHIYRNGLVNDQFLAYRRGYAYGKAIGRDDRGFDGLDPATTNG